MQSGWIEIFFLAMLAGFVALRLYHVLGRRTGHEKPASESIRPRRPEIARPDPRTSGEPEPVQIPELPADIEPGVRPGLEEIMRADRHFAPARFLGAAQAAYGMTLEAFWKGDSKTLADLVSDEILASFNAVITQRQADGERPDNRLLQVDRATIVDAHLNGAMAEITVRFDAEIVSATRDAEGRIIAGDAERGVETHDLWTFSRHTKSIEPAWLLIATEEEL